MRRALLVLALAGCADGAARVRSEASTVDASCNVPCASGPHPCAPGYECEASTDTCRLVPPGIVGHVEDAGCATGGG